MKAKRWKVGDLMLFAGRNGPIYGIVLKPLSNNFYKIIWFDDGQCSDEKYNDVHNRVSKLG